MDIIKGVLLVAFVIICVLLVLLVLVQDQDNSGMGGLLGGGNSTAFGSHSASVLTKATIVFVVLFFVLTFAIAKILPAKSSSTDADMLSAAEVAGKTVENVESILPKDSGNKWWDDSAKSESNESSENVENNVSDANSNSSEAATTEVNENSAEKVSE